MLNFPVPGAEHVSVSVPRVGKSINQRDHCFLWEYWTCASVTHVRIKDSQKTWNCFQKVQSLITRGVVHYQHWKALCGSFCGLWCEYKLSDTLNTRLSDLLGKTSCFLARCLIGGRSYLAVYAYCGVPATKWTFTLFMWVQCGAFSLQEKFLDWRVGWASISHEHL